MSNHRALPVKYIKCGIGLCSLIIALQLHDNYRLWLQVSKLITAFQLHCFIQRCCYLHDIVQMLGNRLTENKENFPSHGAFAWDSASIWRVIEETRIRVWSTNHDSVQLLARAVTYWVLVYVKNSGFDNGVAKWRIGKDEKIYFGLILQVAAWAKMAERQGWLWWPGHLSLSLL